MTAITQILADMEKGDPVAAEKLLPFVYDELRKLAAAKLSQEKPGQTLQATALVHEAYLKLVGPSGNDQSWDNRGHFFAAAAEAMRRILVENARRKNRIKHGGDLHKVDLELIEIPTRMTSEELVSLDAALEELNAEDPVKAQLVALRYFGGMRIEEACEILGISRVTAHRYWEYSRAWLRHRMMQDETA